MAASSDCTHTRHDASQAGHTGADWRLTVNCALPVASGSCRSATSRGTPGGAPGRLALHWRGRPHVGLNFALARSALFGQTHSVPFVFTPALKLAMETVAQSVALPTRVGAVLVLKSPKPSWPESLYPQAQRPPSFLSASVDSTPVDTAFQSEA